MPPAAISTPSLSADQTWSGNEAFTGKLRVGSGVPWYDVTAPPFNAKFDGSTDDTAAIQLAIDTASSVAGTSATTAGGGKVLLPVGTAVITHLTMKRHVALEGQGMWSTVLFQKNSSNQDMISVLQSPDNILPSGQFWSIRKLQLNGNKGNQTSGHGITLTMPANVATDDNATDSRWTLEYLLLYNVKQNGFNQIGTRNEGRVVSCHAFLCDGYGFHEAGSDITYTGCNSGGAGLAGFHCQGTSIRYHGCKSWFSGQINTGNTGAAQVGHGFHLDTTAPGGVTFSDCEAQDNAGAGFYIANSSHRTNVSGICDSNSHYTTGDKPAVVLDGSSFCIINVCAYERSYDGVNYRQRNAIRLINGAANNSVTMTHSAHPGASTIINDPVDSASTAVEGNDLRFNGQGGYETLTFAASITPAPYTATTKKIVVTANITINNTVDTGAVGNTFLGLNHKGLRMRFVFAATGAGPWTVSWGTQYKLSAAMSLTTAKTSIVEFEADGTNWVQCGAQLNNF